MWSTGAPRGSWTSPVRWNWSLKKNAKNQAKSLNCEKKRKIDFLQEIQCFHLLSDYSGGGDVCVDDSVNGTIKQAHDCITEDFDVALSLLFWSAE